MSIASENINNVLTTGTDSNGAGQAAGQRPQSRSQRKALAHAAALRKKLYIGGGVLVAGLVVYYIIRRRK